MAVVVCSTDACPMSMVAVADRLTDTCSTDPHPCCIQNRGAVPLPRSPTLRRRSRTMWGRAWGLRTNRGAVTLVHLKNTSRTYHGPERGCEKWSVCLTKACAPGSCLFPGNLASSAHPVAGITFFLQKDLEVRKKTLPLQLTYIKKCHATDF